MTFQVPTKTPVVMLYKESAEVIAERTLAAALRVISKQADPKQADPTASEFANAVATLLLDL